jgi:hypothetical protein
MMIPLRHAYLDASFMTDLWPTQAIPGVLVIADISGYTRFSRMHYTSQLHAEQIISELMDSIIQAAEFPLQVGQLEGDAVLMYVETLPGKEVSIARDVLAQVERFFAAFNHSERSLIACDAGCVCDACSEIGELRLKAVVHVGEFVQRSFRDISELAGSDITFIRTMLKLPLPEREHILLTEQFFSLSGGFRNDMLHDLRQFSVGDDLVSVHVYLPQIDIGLANAAKGSGPALSKRLNQHSFSRMLLNRPRAKYNNLFDSKMNLPLYLLEGISSGINVLRKALLKLFRRNPPQMKIQPAMLLLVEVRAAGAADPADVDRALKSALNMARPPLVLNKLEGNAVFLYAPAENDNFILAENILRQAGRMYSAFIKWSLSAKRDVLLFRVVCHFGDVVIKQVDRQDELAGVPVILIHRLLQATNPSASAIWMTGAFSRFAKGLSFDEVSVVSLEGLGNERLRTISFSRIQ